MKKELISEDLSPLQCYIICREGSMWGYEGVGWTCYLHLSIPIFVAFQLVEDSCMKPGDPLSIHFRTLIFHRESLWIQETPSFLQLPSMMEAMAARVELVWPSRLISFVYFLPHVCNAWRGLLDWNRQLWILGLFGHYQGGLFFIIITCISSYLALVLKK